MKSKQFTEPLVFRATPELRDRVRRYAARLEVSQGAVMRLALREFLSTRKILDGHETLDVVRDG